MVKFGPWDAFFASAILGAIVAKFVMLPLGVIIFVAGAFGAMFHGMANNVF